MFTLELEQLEKNFGLFLKTSGISAISSKNYLVDFRHFLAWLNANQGLKDVSSLFMHLTPQVVFDYKDFLVANRAARKTVNRRFSTLRKFCQFAIREHLITQDPTEGIKNLGDTSETNLERILKNFGQNLKDEGVNKITIKNYLSDLRHFLGWVENT
jgi:site-specific recombinase XerD